MKATTKKAFELFLMCVLEESEERFNALEKAARDHTMTQHTFDSHRELVANMQQQVGKSSKIMNEEFKKLEASL